MEDNLSPFDSKIACLCQSIEINNNKYIYRQMDWVKQTESDELCLCFCNHLKAEQGDGHLPE